jgi:hypothetical protein
MARENDRSPNVAELQPVILPVTVLLDWLSVRLVVK